MAEQGHRGEQERRLRRETREEEDRRDRMIPDTGRIYTPVCPLIRHRLGPLKGNPLERPPPLSGQNTHSFSATSLLATVRLPGRCLRAARPLFPRAPA